ncbi:DUF2878 domain-containing protein [Vibrio sp. Of7-15]|uniref:DUF2878 domain-containing protein n=1 Tax=Vibrio sp. Of7-15 TaxID=2724879 RepID=UPI001EF2735E|nr:DUF2878 domain-containing protein [Vibrio sp. Of7-15]MCG7497866.1 DUF2878 domain-containing protein [Vibrio sp. Of7-15]
MKSFWVINLVLFQASWLCAAVFTDIAHIVMPMLLMVHFGLSPIRRKDLKVLMLLPLGLIIDKGLLVLGIFNAGDGFFPLWLGYLWIMFILSLNHSLKWLGDRSLIFLILIGALGGSSSYWGGIKLGVLESELSTFYVVTSLMVVWGGLLPILVRLQTYVIEDRNLT